jgi:hypothetical protein
MATYRLDGLNVKSTYGISVLSCDGNLSILKRKGETGYSWPDEDGEEPFVNAGDITFEPRDISLTCLLRGETKTSFLTRLNNLRKVLESSGLHTLFIGTTGVTHSVYMTDGGTLSLLGKVTNRITVGRFILKFREPVPARAI